MKFKKIWENFILILSVYVLIELGYEIIYDLSESQAFIINTIDLVICLIFLTDFFFFLFKSKDKKGYIKRYWIDFIASIPFMTIFRFFRVARVFRIIRLARGIKAIIPIFRKLGTTKSQNILIAYIAIVAIVLLYCSLAFFEFERGVNPNVKVYYDALWWGFVTLTTIGYGDIFPFTTQGRIIGMILSLMGMGFFSLVTAELATKFMKMAQNNNHRDVDPNEDKYDEIE